MKNVKLIKFHQWNKEIAIHIAKQELITMNKHHWEIIHIIRAFYLKFEIIPSMRILIKILNKETNNKYSTRYLFQLFPKGPIKQAYKIAKIPVSKNCF